MTISLSKGGNVSLSKTIPGLTVIDVGLGWDTRQTDGADFDLDAVLFMCGSNGKVRSDADFIFYGMPKINDKLLSSCGSIEHMGDNRTGEGDGDDETIKIDVTKVPADIDKLVIAVTIHEAEKHGQNFGQVSNAFMRVINAQDGVETARHDLSEDYSTETALIFGEIYRHNTEWKFRAVAAGFKGGLGALAKSHGVNIG